MLLFHSVVPISVFLLTYIYIYILTLGQGGNGSAHVTFSGPPRLVAVSYPQTADLARYLQQSELRKGTQGPGGGVKPGLRMQRAG